MYVCTCTCVDGEIMLCRLNVINQDSKLTRRPNMRNTTYMYMYMCTYTCVGCEIMSCTLNVIKDRELTRRPNMRNTTFPDMDNPKCC